MVRAFGFQCLGRIGMKSVIGNYTLITLLLENIIKVHQKESGFANVRESITIKIHYVVSVERRNQMSGLINEESYWRQKIADEISNTNLKDGEWPSSDWCAATLRTQLVCAAIARGNHK